MSEQKEWPMFLDSAEVAEVVGILPTLLNKFVERRMYGIAPSFRSGKGRGSRRLFSDQDVYGVALVWWLFEAGLRSQTIQYVLNQICEKGRKVAATDAAWILLNAKIELIAIRREPRTAANSGRAYPKQKVFLEDWTAASHLVEDNATASVLFIPIFDRFLKLNDAMQKFVPSTGKRQRS